MGVPSKLKHDLRRQGRITPAKLNLTHSITIAGIPRKNSHVNSQREYE